MKLSVRQKRVFTVLFTVLAPLIIIEVYLRVIQYGSMAFWQPDSTYGKSLIANGKGWYTNEGKAFVEINNLGYHDQNHEIEKPTNVFRVAVLGDSFVEAVQLPYQQSFWSLLSKKLQTCPAFVNKTIETFGFGVSNYGTGHQLLMLRNEVLKYQPDEVVLSFYQGNDIADNSSFYISGPSPAFSFQDDNLSIDYGFAQKPEFTKRMWLVKIGYYRLILEFRVLELIRNSIKLLPNIFRVRKQPNIERTNDGVEDAERQKKYAKEDEKAWQLTKRLLTQFENETKKANVGFTLLGIPHPNLLFPGEQPELNTRLSERLQQQKTIDEQLAQFAENSKIDAVNLSKELLPFVNNHHYLYGFENNRLGFGHFSQYGHEKTAEVLAQQLCAKQSQY